MADTPPPPAPSPRTRTRNRVLAAVAVLAVFILAAASAIFFFRPREPSWKLVAVSGTPSVQLDGAPVTTEQIATLRPGSHLRVGPGGSIVVGIEEAVPIRIESGAEATLGSSKGGLGGSLPSVTLHGGTLRADRGGLRPGFWVETYSSSVLFQGTPFWISVRGETVEVSVDSVGADVLAKETGEMSHVAPGERYLATGDSTDAMTGLPGMVPDSAAADSAGPPAGGAPAAKDTTSP